MSTVSSRLGEFLTKAAQTPDLETALWTVLSEYVDMKTSSLKETISVLEEKWGMSFEEFARRSHEGTLDKDIFSWEFEQDFWEWEQAATLLAHYEDLRL